MGRRPPPRTLSGKKRHNVTLSIKVGTTRFLKVTQRLHVTFETAQAGHFNAEVSSQQRSQGSDFASLVVNPSLSHDPEGPCPSVFVLARSTFGSCGRKVPGTGRKKREFIWKPPLLGEPVPGESRIVARDACYPRSSPMKSCKRPLAASMIGWTTSLGRFGFANCGRVCPTSSGPSQYDSLSAS